MSHGPGPALNHDGVTKSETYTPRSQYQTNCTGSHTSST